MPENSLRDNKKKKKEMYMRACGDTRVRGRERPAPPVAGQHNLYKSGPCRMFDPELHVQ